MSPAVLAAFRRRGAIGSRVHAVGEPIAERRLRLPARRSATSRASRYRSCARLVGDHATACSRCATTRAAPTRSTQGRLDASDPGLTVMLTLRPSPRTRRPRRGPGGARPRVAILREQGVNGQIEMAAAFDARRLRGGRRAHERRDRGRASISRRSAGSPPAAGFSYGDVLGAGGAGPSPSSSTRARARRSRASSRAPTPSPLGVCNGCQMMSHLNELIPGAAGWPRFVPQPLRAVRGPAVAGRGPALRLRCCSRGWPGRGSPSPSPTARAARRSPIRGAPRRHSSIGLVALRFVDHHGRATERYPAEPQRLAGRHHRPHHPRRPGHHPDAAPRALFRAVQHSWHPATGARTPPGCACSGTPGGGWGRPQPGKARLQSAIRVELATLPPYLCAMWFVKTESDPVRARGQSRHPLARIKGIFHIFPVTYFTA